MKDALKERSEEKARKPRANAKTDEQNVVSIHDQDTAELEIPDFAKEEEHDKAA